MQKTSASDGQRVVLRVALPWSPCARRAVAHGWKASPRSARQGRRWQEAKKMESKSRKPIDQIRVRDSFSRHRDTDGTCVGRGSEARIVCSCAVALNASFSRPKTREVFPSTLTDSVFVPVRRWRPFETTRNSRTIKAMTQEHFLSFFNERDRFTQDSSARRR